MCERCAGKAVVRTAQDADMYWYDGGLMAVRAGSQLTGGSISVIHVTVPRGKATPLHKHPDAEESFYVIDGDITVHVDGIDHELAAGATSTVRRDTPHAFAVRSEVAHLLVMFTPGGGEQFFIDAGAPAQRPELPPPGTPDLERFRAAAAANGVVLLGPPPFHFAEA